LIRVVLADDHPHVRWAIRHVLELENDFEVVGEADDGARAVEEVSRTRPDLVVLDYRMPKLNGIEVAREVSRIAPRTAMVMLTSEDDVRVRTAAATAGVTSYLLKSGRADDLLRTLRAAVGPREPISIILTPEGQTGQEGSLPPPRIA
jgi:DNA-binding NarL/FixJ family response regulator